MVVKNVNINMFMFKLANGRSDYIIGIFVNFKLTPKNNMRISPALIA
jgi:hypothetical protein